MSVCEWMYVTTYVCVNVCEYIWLTVWVSVSMCVEGMCVRM